MLRPRDEEERERLLSRAREHGWDVDAAASPLSPPAAASGGGGGSPAGWSPRLEEPEEAALCRALLEGTRDDALIADDAGTIRFISRGLAAAAGSEPAGLVGEPADRALGLMELPSFAELRSMLSTVSSARMEAELVDRGEERSVLLRGVSVALSPEQRRYVWFVTPLSRVRTVEQANRFVRSELGTKSRVLALVSHELRTPLNVILSQLSLLEAELRGPLTEEQMDCVSRSLEAGRGLLSLINDMIDFAKIENEDPDLEVVRFRPSDLVSEAAETISAAVAENAELELAVSVPEELEVEADFARSRQILLKLLANAVKYSDGGTIRVKVQRADTPPEPAEAGGGDFVGFDVSDTGAGLALQDVDRVFEPFEQATDVLSRTAGGTGLGLAIARRLAQLQGGDLLVHRASSEGSVFRLYLPEAG